MLDLPNNDDDIMDWGLSFLQCMGEYKGLEPRLLRFWRIFNVCALIFTLWFTSANLSHTNGVGYMKTMEAISTTVHTLLKYLVFIYYKPSIQKLLEDKTKFWDYKDFGGKLVRNTRSVFTFVKFVQFFNVSAIVLVSITYWLRPCLVSDVRFMYDCWVYPDSIVLETIVLACQYYALGAAIPIVMGYDFVYLSYCTLVAMQLQLLNRKFRNMTMETKIEEIGVCIRHHQFLLEISRSLNSIYFWMLLFHYFVTLATSCSQLYIILLGNNDASDFIGILIYITGMLVQFAYYTFPAEGIVSGLRSISDAVYSSAWYNRNVRVRKLLLVIMMKAQQEKYFSAGGMIDINVDAFSSVIRKTFSFYTVLGKILNK